MNFPDVDKSGAIKEVLPAKPKEPVMTQTIRFATEDAESVEVTARNVVVNSPVGDHVHGSSRIKFKNIVDYKWENREYGGQLLAIHVDGDFLAYSIKAPNNPNGMVRVAHRSTQKRCLLKGMTGQVQDLSFAYISVQLLLGCVDEAGNVLVHSVSADSDAVTANLVLHVVLPTEAPAEHRVLWCPYIPDVDDMETDTEDDSAKLILATQGNKAYIWNVGFMASRFGSATVALKDKFSCYLCIEDHSQPIVDAAFSPDGTSLATASCDGFVMFFQIYMNSDNPRCLYKWPPHDGKPLSCIFFMDDRNRTEQFWKFVITGAEKNSVLKIWSCQSWACLQTIIFVPSPSYPTIALKAGLDQTAKYLLLSDIHRRAMFIMHFDYDNDDATAVYCKRISQFYLPHPILSFGIVDIGLKRSKSSSSCSDNYPSVSNSPVDSQDEFKDIENDDICMDNEMTSNGHEANANDELKAVVRLYLIQPNRLQEGRITFVPYKNENSDKSLHMPECPDDTLEFKDVLDISQAPDLTQEINSIPKKDSPFHNRDESDSSEAEKQLNNILVQQSQQLKNLLMHSQIGGTGFTKQLPSPSSVSSLLMQSGSANSSIQPSVNLMTPDAFSSSKHDDDHPMTSSPDVCIPSAPIIDTDMLNNSINLNSSDLMVTDSLHSLQNTSRGFVESQSQSNACDPKFASGGSSPSREVQEILSVKSSDCFYDDNINEEVFFSPNVNHLMTHNSGKNSSGGPIESSTTVWPSINLAKINEANQRKSIESNDKSGTHNKNNSSVNLSKILFNNEGDLITRDVENNENVDTSLLSSTRNDTCIASKIDKLATLLQEQQKEMSLIRNELSVIRRIQQNNVQDGDYANNTSVLIEQALAKSQNQFKQLIDSAITSRIETERIHREALLSGVSQIMGAQLAEKLNSSIAHETRNNLIPLIERLLEPVGRSLQLEISKKLTATDHLLTENIQKLVNNKSVIENLCSSISLSILGATKDAFKQSIQSSLIPHLEKAQSQMFKQLNQSFSSGTKEYLLAFENCTKRTLDCVGNVNETLEKAKTVATHLQIALDQQNKSNNNNNNQSTKQFNNMSKDIQSTISNTLQGVLEDQLLPFKESIREQIVSGMAAQAAILEDSVLSAVRSGTQTPAPSVIDVLAQQHHIENLLKNGQMNAAFQYALSASDLKLVSYTCNMVDPQKVFCLPCPLQPNVMLSLIQQLSADMTSDTPLKCGYLGEAIMYLKNELENPLIKEHVPMVVKELQMQIKNFLLHNKNNPSTYQLKLLMLGTDSILKS